MNAESRSPREDTSTREGVGPLARARRSAAFPVGARIEIAQAGAGQITVGGAGVTLRLPAGKQAKTRLQYSVIALTKRNTDEWTL